MSVSGLALVLIAALLHAAWNAIVKASGDRLIAAWSVVVAAALGNLPVLAIVGLPSLDVWPFLAASAAVHIAYNLTLVTAYDRADLSVAYPIARGTAPLLVMVGGILLLGDPAVPSGVLGVGLVSAGLAILASERPIRHARWALATGATIALYTVIDGAGVRANGNAAQFIGAVFVLHAIPLTVIVGRTRGLDAMRVAIRSQPGRLLFAGLASAGAYLLVMIVARTEPLGPVAGLRETSALFGVLIGALLLGEPVSRRHGLAVVVAGIGTVAIAMS